MQIEAKHFEAIQFVVDDLADNRCEHLQDIKPEEFTFDIECEECELEPYYYLRTIAVNILIDLAIKLRKK